MAHFMGTLCILALGLMMHLRDGDAHRLCGFKLAKIIRQVCDVAECDSTSGLLQIDADDEQGSLSVIFYLFFFSPSFSSF